MDHIRLPPGSGAGRGLFSAVTGKHHPLTAQKLAGSDSARDCLLAVLRHKSQQRQNLDRMIRSCRDASQTLGDGSLEGRNGQRRLPRTRTMGHAQNQIASLVKDRPRQHDRLQVISPPCLFCLGVESAERGRHRRRAMAWERRTGVAEADGNRNLSKRIRILAINREPRCQPKAQAPQEHSLGNTKGFQVLFAVAKLSTIRLYSKNPGQHHRSQRPTRSLLVARSMLG